MLVLFFAVVSCQKDELFEKGKLSSSPNFKVSRISFEEVPHKNEAAALIEKIHKKENNSLLQGKGVYDSINKFTVHTDEIVLITSETTHWLNFYISRETPTPYFENLILCWNKGIQGYYVFRVEYNFTENERLEIANGKLVENINGKIKLSMMVSGGQSDSSEGRVDYVDDDGNCWVLATDYELVNIENGQVYYSSSHLEQVPCPPGVGGINSDNGGSWPDSFFPWVTDVVDGNDYNGDGTPDFNGIDLSDSEIYIGAGDPDNDPPCTHCPPPIISVPILPEEPDPCDQIAAQLADEDFTDKMDELDGKTNLHHETGYSQGTDGEFVELGNVGNNSLSIPTFENMTGFIHCHLDDWDTGKIDEETGAPIIKTPIRMPSPQDIKNLLTLALAAQDNNIGADDVHVTMVSSTGDYTIRFTGNVAAIDTTFSPTVLNPVFEQYFDKYGDEKAFLNFLKEEIPNSAGIRLFKIKNSGTIKEKFLNENGNVDSEKCP